MITDIYTKEIEERFDKRVLQNMPVKLVTRSRAIMIEYVKKHKVDEQTAIKYEDASQELLKKYLSLSFNSEQIIAQNSNHFIHLTNFDALKDAINGIQAVIG